MFWFCYVCLEICSAVLLKFLRKKKSLKKFVTSKIFCSTSDKIPILVDYTCILTI